MVGEMEDAAGVAKNLQSLSEIAAAIGSRSSMLVLKREAKDK
jgi:hypothetical protein